MKHSDQKGTAEMVKDNNGLDQVLLREPRGASARVNLFGGQVSSWKNDQGEELLFMSSKYFWTSEISAHNVLNHMRETKNDLADKEKLPLYKSYRFLHIMFILLAIFRPPKAIRGGIPICFPQFGSSGSLEQHGFARNKFWNIDNNPPPFPSNCYNNKAVVDLILKPTEEDFKSWPHCFEFRLRVALAYGGDLTLISRIRNTDSKPFTFSFAYHTYFCVSDISEVRIEGLETLDYLDLLQDKERFTEQSDAITFESEIDRVYLSTPTKIAIIDHEKKRTYVLRKDGLADAVVWNPWEKKAKVIADFGDEEYKHMLCVDGAAIETPITLKPGEEWKGRIELSAVPSSYCSGQLDPLRVLEG